MQARTQKLYIATTKKCNFHLENQPASLCTVVITKEFGYAIKYNTIFYSHLNAEINKNK